MQDGQLDALQHLNTIAKYEVRSFALTSPQNGLQNWTSLSGQKVQQDGERKFKVDDKANRLVSKVMYDQMDQADKMDYLKVKIQQYEQSLRERTDHTL